MGGKQTAPRSKRKTGISSKEGRKRGGKRRKYSLLADDWGAPRPTGPTIFGSTDIRVRGGGGATIGGKEGANTSLLREQ